MRHMGGEIHHMKKDREQKTEGKELRRNLDQPSSLALSRRCCSENDMKLSGAKIQKIILPIK